MTLEEAIGLILRSAELGEFFYEEGVREAATILRDFANSGCTKIPVLAMGDTMHSERARIYNNAENTLDALENLYLGIEMGWDLDGLVLNARRAIEMARQDSVKTLLAV